LGSPLYRAAPANRSKAEGLARRFQAAMMAATLSSGGSVESISKS